MKLFTIGDNLSQGFMSGGAARTDQAYSTLLAKLFSLKPGSFSQPGIDYYFPTWPANGIPFNLEDIFRTLNARYADYQC